MGSSPFLNFLRGMETGERISDSIIRRAFLNFLRGMETATWDGANGTVKVLPKLP